MRFSQEELETTPPPGPHPVRIDRAIETTSRAGNPMVRVQLQLLDKPHQDKIVQDFFVVGGQNSAAQVGRRRLLGLFRAARLVPEPAAEVELDNLRGRVVCAHLINDDFQGQVVARVRYYTREPLPC